MITVETVGSVNARLILQSANVPATIEAEKQIHKRGILIALDFIANDGGVICDSEEYQGRSETEALVTVVSKISLNMKEVLTRAAKENTVPRKAAMSIARKRLETAMSFRR